MKEINNNIDLIRKRKEVPEEATSIKNKKQRTNKISHSEQEKLKREVSRLQREITLFKTNWMRKSFAYYTKVLKIYFLSSSCRSNSQLFYRSCEDSFGSIN